MIAAPSRTVILELGDAPAGVGEADGGEDGIDAPPPGRPAEPAGPVGHLASLRLHGGAAAIEISAGEGRVARWSIERVSIEAADHGLALHGAGTLEVTVSGSGVEGCGAGLYLDADLGDAVEATHHLLEVRDCRFLRCREAGVLREGHAGLNRAPRPYLFRDCRFEGNEIGLHLALPGGDAPLAVEACRFTENRLMGMRLAGQNGDGEAMTRIEDCRFETNGTGLYLTNLQVTTLVNRCRVLSSLGNGLFVGCFAGRPGRTVITNSLLANNGASGLLAVSDGSRLTLDVAGATLCANRVAGLLAKVRHGGTQDHRVVNSILWGNGQGVIGLDADRIGSCIVQDETLASGPGNLRMDPLFEDATRGSFTLRAGSPAIDAGADDAAALEGPLDLDARPRVRDGNQDGEARIDIGAFERQHP